LVFLLSTLVHRGSLGLLPILAHDRQHWQRGTGSVVLKPTPYGEQLLPKIKEVALGLLGYEIG